MYEMVMPKLSEEDRRLIARAFGGRQCGKTRFFDACCPICGKSQLHFETFADFFQHMFECQIPPTKEDAERIYNRFMNMTYLESLQLRVERIISGIVDRQFQTVKINMQTLGKPNRNQRVYCR